MIKHLLTAAVVLAGVAGAAAVLPKVNRAEVRNAMAAEVQVATEVTDQVRDIDSYEVPDPKFELSKQLASGVMQMEELKFTDALPEEASLIEASVLPADGKSMMKAPRKAEGTPRLTEGTLISKDVNYQGSLYSYRLSLDAIEGTDSLSLNNIYGLDCPVKIAVDKTTGEVSIPQQVMYVHSTYGDISLIPIDIRANGFYLVNGDLKGTLDSKGMITLGSWALMCTGMNADGTQGAYYGRLLNIFSSSELNVPNIIVSCNNVAESKVEMFEAYMDQPSPAEATFYSFVNINTSTVLSARVTADKRIVMSPQLIYNNMYYGPFYNYPATLTYDDAKSQWKVSVNSKGNMEFSLDSDGSYTLPGYAIAARASTSTVAYAYKDVLVIPDLEIQYPEVVKLDLKGAGTQAEPYCVSTMKDLTAISQAVEGGNNLAGVYFRMDADIDFASVSPTGYVPVGTTETPFQGSFDGNGKKFLNVNINGKGFYATGIFGVVGADGSVGNFSVEGARVVSSGNSVGVAVAQSYGTIHDITVTRSSVDCDGELGGGIVGDAEGGVINNCVFKGSVTSVGSAAGIAAECIRTKISNCAVEANLSLDAAISSMNKQLGGIVGTALQSEITNCYNTGTLIDQAGYGYVGGIGGYIGTTTVKQSFNSAVIQAKRAVMGSAQSADDGDTNTGGLAGYIVESVVSDCYNSGTIIKSEKSECVGGLFGYFGARYVSSGSSPTRQEGVSTVTNCYNSGQIISSSTESRKGVFGKTFVSTIYSGPSPDEVGLINCYYDSQINSFTNPRFGRTTAELTGSLPESFDASVWTAEQGRYPMLKNTGAASQARELSSVAVLLRATDNSQKVKVGFDLSKTNNTDWELSHNEEAGETATETAALKMEGTHVTVKDKYASAVVEALSNDGWSVKLYSLSIVPKVFDGEGTAEDPYMLKEVNDYVKLNEAVATYAQAHLGDFFAIANDVDFEGTDLFKGVGYGTAHEFKGTLDGRNHKIKGLKIDTRVYKEDGSLNTTGSYVYGGFVNILGEGGTIKNLIIADDCDLNYYSYGGAVTGLNNGLIENCKNYATVNGIQNYFGGITGVNYDLGTVRNCYSAGAVNFGISNAGGIVGYNRPGGVVENCQNDGNVFNKVIDKSTVKTKSNTAGGVVGYNMGLVNTCVNNGQVRAYNTVGGIIGVGYNDGKCEVKGSLNNGMVTSIDESLYRGGIVGKISSTMALFNNVYDGSINVNGAGNNNGISGVTSLSSSELVSGNAIEGLDAELFDFKTNSYPVLKAFAEEEASKALRSLYVAFGPKVMRTNVLQNTPVAKGESISFKLESKAGSVFSIGDGMLNVTKPEGMMVSTDSLTAMNTERYVKTYNLSAVPVILKGDGTAESPYLIETPEDWNKLADFMLESKWEYSGNTFRIENDLDFKGDSIRLLAVKGVNFLATLDGAGHTMKNFVYSNPNSSDNKAVGPNAYKGQYLGLIGTLGSTGTVKDLTTDGLVQGHSYMAGVVGENYGRIENVIHKGTLETLTNGYAAGVAYRSYAGSSIVNCQNVGKVIAKKTYAYGIVYETKAESLLENCANHGEVTAMTTIAGGIAFKVAGTIKNCINDGKISATGTIHGLVNTLDKTGHMEDCENRSDIDLASLATPGSNIAGLVGTLTALTAAQQDGVMGHVVNCHNYGNLKAKGNVYGCFTTVNAGWTISDCSNRGDITATATGTTTGYGNGFANKLAGAKDGLNTVVKNCYNTGNVLANGTKVSGFAAEAANYSELYDCYNLGSVTSTYSGLTTAGLVGQFNGWMERCFNAGDVKSAGNAVGGLVGYISYGAADKTAKMSQCFNVGDVESTFTGTSTNGNAGGLGGYIATATATQYAVISDCYNTGNVTANQRVGGLFAGSFQPYPVVTNCYNSGKVTCKVADSQGRYYWSGTTFTNNYTYVNKGDTILMLNGHSNCFYDKTVNPGSQFRNVPGSAKTTAELRELVISDAFTALDHKGYPVLKIFAEEDAAHFGSALILLANKSGEAHDNITESITLVGPADAEWYAEDLGDTDNAPSGANASSRLVIRDGKAVPKAVGKARLYCEYKGMTKSFDLNVTAATTGLDEIFGGKDVKSVEYIDMQGNRAAVPTAGQVYVVRTVYSDGTISVEKKMAVE